MYFIQHHPRSQIVRDYTVWPGALKSSDKELHVFVPIMVTKEVIKGEESCIINARRKSNFNCSTETAN